jgi:hypothetical protein
VPIGERNSEARTEFHIRGGLFSPTSLGLLLVFGARLRRPARCVHSRRRTTASGIVSSMSERDYTCLSFVVRHGETLKNVLRRGTRICPSVVKRVRISEGYAVHILNLSDLMGGRTAMGQTDKQF